MSAACFTCSRTTGTVPLFTNTCYWDILRSLLTPDDINIDHVCFPSPNLRLCTKCKKVLLSISEFRNIAVNSVRTQLEQWHQDMDPLGIVKMETENVDIKQEVISEDPVCDKERERASLHEEVMLESPEDTMCQIKLEPETLITEDDQNELDSYLEDASNSDEDGAGSDENLDRKIKSDPENETTDPENETTDPVTTRSRRKEKKNPEPSTSTEHTQTRKRNSLPERPPTNAKKTAPMKNTGSRATKRDFDGKTKIKDEQTEWCVEIEEDIDFSDVDDPNADQHETAMLVERSERKREDGNSEESIKSDTDDENIDDDEESLTSLISEVRDSTTSYIGNNGFVWSKTETEKTNTIPAPNITQVSEAQPTETVFQAEAIWSKIFDDEMITAIVEHTNEKLLKYRQEFGDTNRKGYQDTDETELQALIGLLYYSGVLKCNNHESSDLFAADGTGHEIFRCIMSRLRFNTLITCLRFDKAADRPERLKTDPLAAISWVFDKFVSNSQENFTLGPNICIDEILVPFRGQCHFVTHMLNSTYKYGIKLAILSDAEKPYTYNAYIHCNENTHVKSVEDMKLAASTQAILRLATPIETTNRNITAGERFSSLELVRTLRAKNLTYLGSLKRNKPEIPREFQANRKKQPGSRLYGFTEDFTLLSYVPEKNKTMLLISSSHHERNTNKLTDEPSMLADYNKTKGTVAKIDKDCSFYSCSRRTRRWPMAIFYRILDLSALNAYTLHQNETIKLSRRNFILQLARQLALPTLKERMYTKILPRELKMSLARVLGADLPPQPAAASKHAGRRLCGVCPSRLKRQTRFACCGCGKPVCLQCSGLICGDCQFLLA